MELSIVRKGDKTSSGGVVQSASETHSIMGIGIARMGDVVSCPLPGHGINKIAKGAATFHIGGIAVALDGDPCECGCRLVASLKTATYG